MVKKRNISDNLATYLPDQLSLTDGAGKVALLQNQDKSGGFSSAFLKSQNKSAPALQVRQELDLDDLLQEAQGSITYLEEAMQNLASGLDVIIEETSLKTRSRANEKLQGECHNIPALLTDLVRGRIVAHDFHTLKKLITRIYSQPSNTILQILNRFERPNERNHRDLIVKILLPNQHVAEIQIHHDAILRASKKTHTAYKIIRRLNERCTLENNRFLTEAEQADYINNIQICINEYTKAVEESGLEHLRKYPLPFPRYIMPNGFLNLSYRGKEEILRDTV